MDLSVIILNFAMGAKAAQIILNQKTGDDAADVPIAIKECKFRYKLNCNMEFSQDLKLKVNWFTSVETDTNYKSSESSELELEITFLNIMALTAEANK